MLAYGGAAAAVLAAAAVQGATGLGFGMLAAPVLAVIDSRLVPGPMLLLSIFISGLTALREIRSIDLPGLGLATTGRIAGTIAAGATVAALPKSIFAVVFAVLILLGVALSLAGWRLLPSARNLIAAGAASGYIGTITSVGAPPMALVYQNVPGPQLRSTMAAFFVIGAVVSLTTLAGFGQLDDSLLLTSLGLLPPLVAGFLLSRFVIGHVDRGLVKPVVLALSAAAAVVLLARAIL